MINPQILKTLTVGIAATLSVIGGVGVAGNSLSAENAEIVDYEVDDIQIVDTTTTASEVYSARTISINDIVTTTTSLATSTTTSTTITTTTATAVTETTTTPISIEVEAVVLSVEETVVEDYVEAPFVEDVAVEDTYYAPVEEFIAYKPSSHYVHRSTCRWYDASCYEITDTEGIEAILCTECNPNIEIMVEYVAPAPEPATSYGVSDDDRKLLAEIVWHEAGSSWISQYDKARIAAGVMNRVNDSRFPNTVYGVLTAPNQFSGFWPGSYTPTQECYDAVDYYFSHTNEFDSCNSWWGDGYSNHFYYQ